MMLKMYSWHSVRCEYLLKFQINNDSFYRRTFSPAVSRYQMSCPAMSFEEADSCNRQTAPQEGANAADQHWVLQ